MPFNAPSLMFFAALSTLYLAFSIPLASSAVVSPPSLNFPFWMSSIVPLKFLTRSSASPASSGSFSTMASIESSIAFLNDSADSGDCAMVFINVSTIADVSLSISPPCKMMLATWFISAPLTSFVFSSQISFSFILFCSILVVYSVPSSRILWFFSSMVRSLSSLTALIFSAFSRSSRSSSSLISPIFFRFATSSALD